MNDVYWATTFVIFFLTIIFLHKFHMAKMLLLVIIFKKSVFTPLKIKQNKIVQWKQIYPFARQSEG